MTLIETGSLSFIAHLLAFSKHKLKAPAPFRGEVVMVMVVWCPLKGTFTGRQRQSERLVSRNAAADAAGSSPPDKLIRGHRKPVQPEKGAPKGKRAR